MPFIGKQPTAGFASIVKDDLTANGVAQTFTLSKEVANANDIAVFLGNVRQEPTDAYTVNGTTLNMSEVPANGLNFYVLHIAGTTESSVIPADGTITPSKLNITQNIAGHTQVQTLGAGDVTLDFTTYQNFILTLTGNINLVNPTTEVRGQTGVIVIVHSGSARTVSLTGTDYESPAGAGINLSNTATTDLIPYMVVDTGRILLGKPQLAFA